MVKLPLFNNANKIKKKIFFQKIKKKCILKIICNFCMKPFFDISNNFQDISSNVKTPLHIRGDFTA